MLLIIYTILAFLILPAGIVAGIAISENLKKRRAATMQHKAENDYFNFLNEIV